MARKKLITRNVKITQGKVLVVNLVSKETAEQDFNIVGSFVNTTKILEKVLEKIEANGDYDIKPVHILEHEVVDKLFGLTEQQFVKNGIELDSKTRKPIETEEVETEEAKTEETEHPNTEETEEVETEEAQSEEVETYDYE